MKLIIRNSQNGEEKHLEVSPSDTIYEVKLNLASQVLLLPSHQRLVISGFALEDHMTVSDCGLINGTTISMMIDVNSIQKQIWMLNEKHYGKKSFADRAADWLFGDDEPVIN